MPPQWNPYEIPDAPPLPPLVAERGPLDDILADVPDAPAQAPPLPAQAIPAGLVSVLPTLPPPPPSLGAPPAPAPASDPYALPPAPPRPKPQPISDMYAIPEPPQSQPAPDDLAPDFSRVDMARSLDAFDAPPTVDAAAATARAQSAERTLSTMTQALGEAQADGVEAAKRAQALEQQAAGLDQRIATLKSTKKPTPEQKAEIATLTKQREAMTGEIAEAGAEVQGARERFTAAQEQQAVAKQAADQARDQASTDLATLELEAERKGAAAQQAGAVLFAKESERIAQDAQAQTAKIESEESAARARMDADRKVYRDALKAGPAKQSMVLTVASVLAEALSARRTGREPNFAGVIGQLEAATKAEFDDQVKRQLGLIAEGEDSLAKAAQQKRVIDAQKAVRLSETLRTIETDIQAKMAGARGTLAEAELAMAAGDVRKQREAADQAAMEALRKANAADEKARLDQSLQEAQIRKANADAAEKEGKNARAGMGKPGVPTGLETHDPRGVYLPGTDTQVALFADDSSGRKQAADARAVIEGRDIAIMQLNEIEAAIEDYGTKNLGDYSKWSQSPEFAKLETAVKFIGPALAQVSSGGTATTSADMEWGEKLVAPPTMATGGKDMALVRLREAKRQMEERYRGSLQKVGLPTRVQEQLISHRGARSTSQRDQAEKLIKQAPKVATDSKRPVADRLEAIAQMSEHSKRAVEARGSEGEQAERAAILDERNVLINVINSIERNEATEDDMEIRAAAEKRKKELEEIWNGIGKSGTRNIDRKKVVEEMQEQGLIPGSKRTPLPWEE